MRCHRARRLMARKASRGLSPQADHALADHMHGCRDCAGLENQLERTWEALSCHPQIEPSADFLAKLRSKLREAPEPAGPRQSRWSNVRWQWVALAAGILLAAVLLTRTPQVFRGTPSVELPARTTVGSDRADEQLLEELEGILQHSETDYLAVYDSWPVPLQETGSPAPEAKRGRADSTVRKDIS